jgi:methionine-rich copper-binding protein CopC
MTFTEPLDHALSTAQLINAHSGRGIRTKLSFHSGNRLVLRPTASLPAAAFTVEWRSVWGLDGHTLDGSFQFGVRTAVAPGQQEVVEGLLSRDGWRASHCERSGTSRRG